MRENKVRGNFVNCNKIYPVGCLPVSEDVFMLGDEPGLGFTATTPPVTRT